MRRFRTIPVLLLADGGMVKPKAFAGRTYLGDPINAVKIFNERMCDELILLDITANAGGTLNVDWIEDIVSEAFMPVAYGGGLKTLEQCAELFRRGVEKVVVNAAAVERPALISEIAGRFGTQSVVVSIDARKNLWRRWKAYTHNARRESKLSPDDLARSCELHGAGELLLTSVEREGSFEGYDIELLRSVTSAVGIPVIAHGGAGSLAHFAAAVREGGASAAAAGSMFVFAAKGEGMLINYPTQDELVAGFWSRIAA